MTTRSRLTCVGALVLLASLVAGAAAAQGPIDKRSTFTFSGPVAVPGVTLPAGSYLFHLTDINNRRVVQVLSTDGKTAYAQFHATETWRNTTPPDAEVRFMETAADMPPAIRAFWTPGDALGYEAFYSADQKRLLLNGLGTAAVMPVAPIPPAAPAYVAPEPAAPVDIPAEVVAVVEEPVVVAEAAPAPEELPKTDSPTATLLLVGLGALLVGVFVRTIRTTMA